MQIKLNIIIVLILNITLYLNITNVLFNKF